MPRRSTTPIAQQFFDSWREDQYDEREWYSPAEPRRSTDLLVLTLLVALCSGAGVAIALSADLAFYEQLALPPWAPDALLFAPVAIVLDVILAVAAWMVWRAPDTAQRAGAIGWFAGQFVLHLVWTPIFFGAHSIATGLVVNVLLFAAVGATIAAFWMVRRSAALLLVPYLAWIGYLTALNAAVWALNR